MGRICGAIALDDGDDAMQETMIRVLKGIRRLREPAALHGWVRRIAVREALKLAPARRPLVPVEQLPEPPAGVAPELPVQVTDTLRQLTAEVLPGVGLVECVLDAPYERVWSFLTDFEHSVPAFDPMVRSLRVRSRQGGRLVVVTRSSFPPVSSRFEVELRDGWCLMRSRTYLVGMAAEPLGDQTRYAHLEGLPSHRAPALRILRPVFRRVVRGDINGIVRTLATPPSSSPGSDS